MTTKMILIFKEKMNLRKKNTFIIETMIRMYIANNRIKSAKKSKEEIEIIETAMNKSQNRQHILKIIPPVKNTTKRATQLIKQGNHNKKIQPK